VAVRLFILLCFTLTGCSDPGLELSEQLGSSDVEQRRAAARTLGEMGEQAVSAIPALSQAATTDTDADVRRLSAHALGQIPTDTDDSLSALKTALTDRDVKVRATAAYAIFNLVPTDASIVPVLIESVQAGDVKAIVVLGRLGPTAKDAVPVLAKALLDRRHNLVRLKAAQSLQAIGPAAASAVPALRQLSNDRDVDVRAAASQAIVAIEH